MCDVIIWSQESVHEDEIEKKEVGKDKTDRNKVRVCLRYGEKRQGLHNGASPEKSKIQWIIHQDCQQPLQQTVPPDLPATQSGPTAFPII